jgi:hypothetical protein
MSGFEIAGVVLGAFPVIFETIKAFQACHDDAKIFFRWMTYVDKIRRQPRQLHVKYKMTIELVLMPITDEGEREEMLSNAESALWHRSDIADLIRSRLHHAYEPFVSLGLEISSIIVEVDNYLKLNRSSTVRPTAHPRVTFTV